MRISFQRLLCLIMIFFSPVSFAGRFYLGNGDYRCLSNMEIEDGKKICHLSMVNNPTNPDGFFPHSTPVASFPLVEYTENNRPTIGCRHRDNCNCIDPVDSKVLNTIGQRFRTKISGGLAKNYIRTREEMVQKIAKNKEGTVLFQSATCNAYKLGRAKKNIHHYLCHLDGPGVDKLILVGNDQECIKACENPLNAVGLDFKEFKARDQMHKDDGLCHSYYVDFILNINQHLCRSIKGAGPAVFTLEHEREFCHNSCSRRGEENQEKILFCASTPIATLQPNGDILCRKEYRKKESLYLIDHQHECEDLCKGLGHTIYSRLPGKFVGSGTLNSGQNCEVFSYGYIENENSTLCKIIVDKTFYKLTLIKGHQNCSAYCSKNSSKTPRIKDWIKVDPLQPATRILPTPSSQKK